MNDHALQRHLAPIALLGILFFGSLVAPPAAAQFVCSDLNGDGQNADASGSTANFACGGDANASGVGSTNVATGTFAEAIGPGSSNTATGFSSFASGTLSNNTATGSNANAGGDAGDNTATGSNANASGFNGANTATGYFADANGESSSNIAIGSFANASGDNTSNTAIGASSNATGGNASAFGSNARATHVNAAAFGAGATTSRDDQQVFGTASNTYTMSGITSAASRTAQGAPTHLVTSNASGDLAARTFADLGLASTGDLSAINNRLDRIGGMAGKAMTGVAMAFAMAGVPTLMPHEKFAVSLNYGTFGGRNGVAFSSAIKLHENVQFNAALGYGVNDDLVGGRVGLRMGWWRACRMR